MKLSISNEEIHERQEKFKLQMHDNGIDGVILFSSADIFYLTNFHFISTERPTSFFVDLKGKTHLLVPQLDDGYAKEHACVDEIHYYHEFPDLCHPMEEFKKLLVKYGFIGKTIGFDSDGYSSPYGYRGPRLSEIIDANFKSVFPWVEEMRYVKSPTEIELIKESCRWGNLAHRLLQKYSKAGFSEVEIASRASYEATLIMVDTLGNGYRPYGNTAFATFRGQVGKLSAYPHIVTQNVKLNKGDNLVTGAAADVWRYCSELERTMFVEEVSPEQEKFFHHMYEAQEVAFSNIKPGQPTSIVDKEVQKYIDENGLREYVPHHTGHAIGLMMHEAPFFDLGDNSIMEPGMVFTVEPGIFVKGLGGFRHSDTVLVTEDGMEMLTYYPRDLESMICY
ncbi:M24 family metallopeptidase [Virgibacillus ndiopensis]|uniref:M24 family metallopeptidase n=1 Tax=Virgibacillus ndiopensis TaxID=2004408 RepID=UPI000C08C8EA|nr:Xaa-Pro peptidase family protein [Virgibacillus ndiopensis]